MNKVLIPFLVASTVFSVSMAHNESVGLIKVEPTQAEEKAAEPNPVVILFTGDIMLGRYIATLRERNGGDFPFTYMPDILAAGKSAIGEDEIDLVLANLEGPIVENQVAYGDMVFRFAPETATLLKKVGFTTVSLANNHTFNQKRAGYTETRDWLTKAGVDSFGQPDTIDAEWSTKIYEIDGVKIGFLGLNDVDFKLSHEYTFSKIAELDKQVDFLIVGIHWGIEYKTTASEYMTTLAHGFVDSGADMIWGQHPHVVENSEIYNGKPIYYSLGNFVFDQYWSTETQKGLVVVAKFEDGEITTAEIPVDLVNKGEPKPSI